MMPRTAPPFDKTGGPADTYVSRFRNVEYLRHDHKPWAKSLHGHQWERIMAYFSILHWLLMLFSIGIILIPCWRIVQKAGFSGVYSLLLFVPVANIIAVWIFSLVEWPVQKRDS